MAVAPVFSRNVAPLLPLVWARVRRTPLARLSLIFEFRREVCPVYVPCDCACNGPIPPAKAVECRLPPNQFEPAHVANRAQRSLGEALLVDRLVTGSILGTLWVLPCNEAQPVVICDDTGQVLDLVA